ncbi:MAG: hypothetical protein U1D55_08055 [Phycisphaerae bacterium]
MSATSTATPRAQPPSAGAPYSEVQRQNARPRLPAFAFLAAQLGLSLYVVREFNVQSPALFLLCCLTFGAFVLHYFTPLAYKKSVFLACSLVGGYFVLVHADPAVFPGPVEYLASGVFLFGLLALAGVSWAILNAPLSAGVRVGTVVAVAAALAYLRMRGGFLSDGQWRVVGGIFMFRLIVYAHEIVTRKRRETPIDTFSYFLLLPNFHFSLFPVIDYDTFKKSWYASDIHATAQRGVAWIVRGIVQLCLHRLLDRRVAIAAEQVNSLLTLCQFIFPTYLLYMQVSGQFHLIAGMLHLFGWRLPETNRNWLLADSFTDFWRRINVYWKDFMVKCFYYPTYFRLRKTNEKLALVAATAVVFVSTTLLHGYQTFWFNGEFRVSVPDAVFWGTLGVLVMFGVLRQSAKPAPRARLASATPAGRLRKVASTIGVYLFISVLWSIWSSPSLVDWLDAVTYWRRS